MKFKTYLEELENPQESPLKYKLGNKGANGLYRIIDIKTGKKGGFVESEKNLSQEGSAWINDNAEVFGEGRVAGAAQVFENAKVYEKAKIDGNAKIHGRAKIFGNAEIKDNAEIFGNARISGEAKISGNVKILGTSRISGNTQLFGNEEIKSGITLKEENTSNILDDILENAKQMLRNPDISV